MGQEPGGYLSWTVGRQPLTAADLLAPETVRDLAILAEAASPDVADYAGAYDLLFRHFQAALRRAMGRRLPNAPQLAAPAQGPESGRPAIGAPTVPALPAAPGSRADQVPAIRPDAAIPPSHIAPQPFPLPTAAELNPGQAEFIRPARGELPAGMPWWKRRYVDLAVPLTLGDYLPEREVTEAKIRLNQLDPDSDEHRLTRVELHRHNLAFEAIHHGLRLPPGRSVRMVAWVIEAEAREISFTPNDQGDYP